MRHGVLLVITFSFLLLTVGCVDKSMNDFSKYLSAGLEEKPNIQIIGRSTSAMGSKNFTPSDDELSIYDAVNEVRKAHNVGELAYDERASAVARAYSERMLKEGFFSHYSPQGEDVEDRLKAANISYRAVGENLAYLKDENNLSGSAIKGWLDSPPHRKTMLSPMYETLGVGVACEEKTCYITTIYLNKTFEVDVPVYGGYGFVELPLNGRVFAQIESLDKNTILYIAPKSELKNLEKNNTCKCYGMWRVPLINTYLEPNDVIIIKSNSSARLIVKVD